MFNEHGEFAVTRQGNILIVHICGSWNVETAVAFGDTIKKVSEPFVGGFWAMHCNVELWELFTPDCHQLMMQLATEFKENGFKKEAVVNSNTNSVKLDLFKKHSEKDIKENSGNVFQQAFFETDADAKKWLNNLGYGQE